MGEPGPLPTPAIDRLTARERQALRMVAEHRQSKEIARQLGISAETVDKHIANARRKLGASSRREAARLLLAGERGRHLPVEPPYGSSGISPAAGPAHADPGSAQGREAGLDRGGYPTGDRPGGASAPGDRTVRTADAGAGAGGGADAALQLGSGGPPDGGPGRAGAGDS